ncbi:UDP-N-acetylglucosamine 2-epimerase (non-hydrolyzing) [Candidatus Bathyarchaeota archaeon]|nr:UDP-N-acetylglucosamine 2-epimerase (non-hydrolyzing) [Candidatus Bathyarchaeota archaeon]
MGIRYTIKFYRYKDRRRNIYALKILKSNKHGHNRQGKSCTEEPFNDAKNIKVKEIRDVGKGSVVYDLSVEDTERFVTAHGVVLHNTNTVLAGALASVKLGVKVGHVEAGLRSYDRGMPEEINRVLADHCSDLLFAPTEKARAILLGEGVADDKIFVTGNTVVDAVFQNLELAKKKASALSSLGLEREGFFLATVHRQENVDCEERFRGILRGLEMVEERFGLPVVYPIHPRARKQLKAFKIALEGLTLVEPLDYLSFLQLESSAKLVLTDSGGVQEETCVLRVPCVTLRDNTERPETLEVCSNVLAGAVPEGIVEKTERMLEAKRDWLNPFGDGKAGKRIVEILKKNFTASL